MKTKKIILSMALLIAGVSAGELMAQEHLNALMKKCESLDNVSVEVIYNKDPKTKKPEKNVVSVTFYRQENAKLLNDFLDAFKKDREAAYRVMEEKINGKVTPSLYRFSGAGDTDITYTVEEVKSVFPKNSPHYKEKGDIRITKVERFNYSQQGG
ncbi:MAG: hypothetical protein PARBA_01130 [Parabacteroides sp.]|jgi:hypothetical protein